MPITQTTPDKAKKTLDQDANAIYVDVRSIPEFEQGHAEGAINIPLMHFDPATGMTPNPDFVQVFEASVAKEKNILVGCKMGGRSQRACELMSQLGYESLSNIDGGFEGNDHQAGWRTLNLPVSTDNGEDSSYTALAAKAKA
jgi:rhodanese-related sulfurtransferase